MNQYVEGYGVKTSYDGPYLKGHDFDPKEAFKFAGDPKKQAAKQEKDKKKKTIAETVKADPKQTAPDTVTIPTPPETPEVPNGGTPKGE